MKISVQAEPFDYGILSNAFAQGHTHVGAVVTFCGIVRDDELGGLSTMEIEYYPGMTEKAIKAHAETAKDRFSLAEVLMDYLKSRAPFWKKEIVNGEPRWVDAKPEDEDALSRW
jgi:molybdopterin synthase catalytic subunit